MLLSSVATIIKYGRKALVYSSDKYLREDCFHPFSEFQDDVVKYIPIVRFICKRVIFVTQILTKSATYNNRCSVHLAHQVFFNYKNRRRLKYP